ncbi:CG31041 [Drosophila busckii]|uniref:CG31041 n=1 Tax=Drosophila busckii TaxID=30019 RepID=A0A0M4EI15_DROBS|nr:CG31041 [Drosophila busckii]
MSMDRQLVDMLMHYSVERAANPALTQYCFNRYLPILDAHSAEYSREYQACGDSYESLMLAADAKYKNQMESTRKGLRESCDKIEKCNSQPNYLQIFECYGNTGSNEHVVIQSLADASKVAATGLGADYEAIESSHDKCCKQATAKYNENYSRTRLEMDNCLNGIVVDPETTTPRPTTKK